MNEEWLIGLFTGVILTVGGIGFVILVKQVLEDWVEKTVEERAAFMVRRHEIREKQPK